MSKCYIKEGLCGSEIVIKAEKISQTKIALEFDTACLYINKLAKLLKQVNVGECLSQPMLETLIYKEAAKCCCRNSCSVPSAIFKIIEVASDTSRPKESLIKFIDKI